MAVEIVPIEPRHLPALRRFAEHTWPERPGSDAFHRWRYAVFALVGYLALRDGECVAMVTGFERPYRIGGEIVPVRESFDWFTRPELKGSGLGVRVLRRLMADDAPVTVIGGSEDTRSLLPRLGFQVPGELRVFALPVGSRRASETLKRRAGVPPAVTRAGFGLLAPLLLAPRRRSAPPDGRVLAVATAGAELEALQTGAKAWGLAPLWRVDHLRWLCHGFGGLGHFAILYFVRGAALVGFSVLRIHPEPEGCVARIVDLFAPEPDAELFTWMVSETACVAAGFAPDFIDAQTSCPEVAEALRRNRFRETASLPIHFYARDRELPGPLFFGAHWGDVPLRPFPGAWWPSGAAS